MKILFVDSGDQPTTKNFKDFFADTVYKKAKKLLFSAQTRGECVNPKNTIFKADF